jgi:hypothetical protein
MSLFWLAYRQNAVTCVLILEASSLISARLKASLQIEGIDDHFERGFELEREHPIPPDVIGRLLTPALARQVLHGLERQIPKRAAAASIPRKGRKKAPAARATRAL